MNRTSRLFTALMLVGVLAVIATGVWASPVFQGTTPHVPVTGGGACNPQGPVDMGTAVFTPLASSCTIKVDKVSDPAGQFVAAPDGLAFVGDAFIVTLDSASDTVKVCYAYPPELAAKNAKIYKLNEEANPKVWEEVTEPAPVIENGTICITSTAGTFALIGNP